MKLNWSILASTLVFAFLFVSCPIRAQSGTSQCEGKLHRDRSGLRIGGGLGEDEGICLINNAEAKKVLAVCALEHRCRVSGHVGLCKDTGECAEISGITSVQRR
jgi:hypothetical protein